MHRNENQITFDLKLYTRIMSSRGEKRQVGEKSRIEKGRNRIFRRRWRREGWFGWKNRNKAAARD